jgi:hypothetical protein
MLQRSIFRNRVPKNSICSSLRSPVTRSSRGLYGTQSAVFLCDSTDLYPEFAILIGAIKKMGNPKIARIQEGKELMHESLAKYNVTNLQDAYPGRCQLNNISHPGTTCLP